MKVSVGSGNTTWGAMLEQGTSFLWKPGFRHYALAAGAAIAWVVLAANLLGDGLRDRLMWEAMDVYLRQRP